MTAPAGRRYLIVRLAALGDVVMASTLPGAIRALDPDAHVTWLCGAGVAPLVRSFDGVDTVLAVDEVALLRGGPWRRLRAIASVWRMLVPTRFHRTVLGHGDARYRVLLLPVRTGRVRALEQRPSPRMLPIPGRWFGDEYVRLLEDADSHGPITGHAPLATVRGLPARADAAPVGVVLVPGGTRNVLRESAYRRWPVERYAELARGLREAGVPVTLVGDAGDAWVRPAFQGIDVVDEIGRHDLHGTLAILRDARLVVSHDTGPLHLARLVRAPLIALFGPTMPSQFVVRDASTEVIWGGATLACRPCYDGREFAACRRNLCMEDIQVAEVLRSALRSLGADAARGVPAVTT